MSLLLFYYSEKRIFFKRLEKHAQKLIYVKTITLPRRYLVFLFKLPLLAKKPAEESTFMLWSPLKFS